MTHDDARPSVASAGSHGHPIPLFSARWRMSLAAVEWCKENDASPNSPVNIVTALLSLGLVAPKPSLTTEEAEALEWISQHASAFGLHESAKALRGLLERLG